MIGFSEADLEAILALCELDQRVTGLIGLRAGTGDAEVVQHRYKTACVAAKANVLLQQMRVERFKAQKRDETSDKGDPRKEPEGEPEKGSPEESSEAC